MNSAVALVARLVAASATMVATLAVSVTAAQANSSPSTAPPCEQTWSGPAGGDWNTAANWTPARVPGADTVVCILGGGSPVLGAGPDGQAETLYLRNSALTVNSQLNVEIYDIGQAVLNGDGKVWGSSGNLIGVELRDNLQFGGYTQVSGSRAMCGGVSSVCLSDNASPVGDFALYSGTKIVTNPGSTAHSDANQVFAIGGTSPDPAEITVRLSAVRIDNYSGRSGGVSYRVED